MQVERIACHGDHRTRRRIKIHPWSPFFQRTYLMFLRSLSDKQVTAPPMTTAMKKPEGWLAPWFSKEFVIVRPLANFYLKLAKSLTCPPISSSHKSTLRDFCIYVCSQVNGTEKIRNRQTKSSRTESAVSTPLTLKSRWRPSGPRLTSRGERIFASTIATRASASTRHTSFTSVSILRERMVSHITGEPTGHNQVVDVP
jgi:hypothetical protein